MVKTARRRAYINPLPGYSEAEQRAAILKGGPVDEWYVESRSVKRADFVQHLRAGDQAVVANIGCLAKATGRIDGRLNDLADARGDIHGKGCVIIDAGGLRSDRDWPGTKAAARTFLLRERSIKNASARKFNYTNAEIKTMMRIKESRRYKNDNQRLAAIAKEGIKAPKRTWFVEKLPVIARERGLVD